MSQLPTLPATGLYYRDGAIHKVAVVAGDVKHVWVREDGVKRKYKIPRALLLVDSPACLAALETYVAMPVSAARVEAGVVLLHSFSVDRLPSLRVVCPAGGGDGSG